MRLIVCAAILLTAACSGAGDGDSSTDGDPATPARDAAPTADSTRGSDRGEAPPPADAGRADEGAPDASPPPLDAAPPDAAPSGPVHGPRPRPRATSELRAPRDWRFARGLIHMHSAHSHDACDGNPRPDGQINEPCMQRFRSAICVDRLDYVLLTDHPTHVEEVPFQEALIYREGDRLERDPGDAPIANHVACPDGHEVFISAGAESSDVMPVLMRRHPTDLDHYRRRDPEALAGLQEAGGLALIAHTESYEPADLRGSGVHGIEVYNLHANLDPRGELQQLREILPALNEIIRAGVNGPHPDLAFLAVLRENPRALAVWDGLTPLGRLVGTAGSDIHENLPPLVRPGDGERIDSYRRLATWFSNYLLLRRVDYDGVRDAVAEGRLFVAFEGLGAPDGFDFHGVLPNASVVEMGSERPFEAGTRLVAVAPLPPGASPVTLTLKRVTLEGVEIVAESTEARLEHVPAGPGVYRLEVRITPEHLRGELGRFSDLLIRPFVWIYANPIYLR